MPEVAATVRPLESGWLADTPVEDNLFRAFVRNQGDLGAIQAVASGGRATAGEGVALADLGRDAAYVNQATLLRPITAVDDPVLDQVDDFWAGESGRAHSLLSIWPTPDLGARGWRLEGHPMLVVRAPAAHRHESPADVSVEVVTSETGLAELERLVIDAYPFPDLAGRPPGSLFAPGLLDTPIRYRIARLDGQAVGAACVHVGSGIVNLCLGATRPEVRRRGVWSSLVWARVDDAPDLPAVAFTSDLSRPGFVRMGFLPVTRCTLWTR